MSVIENILTKKGFEVSSVYNGVIDKDNWKRHSWSVLIQGNGVFIEIDYGKGLGHNAGDGVTADDIIPCLIMDASYGNEFYSDFCGMFGYDEYDDEGGINQRSEAIWEACREQVDNLQALGLTADELEAIELYIEDEGL